MARHNMILGTAAAALALAAGAASADVIISGGGLEIAEEGGVFGPGNVANTGSAFAPDIEGQDGGAPQQPTGYGGAHTTTGVNDLQYGNTGAWLAGSAGSFIGINLGSTPQTLASIAFGRDNGGEPTQYKDRADGRSYTLQYTQLANPDTSTFETGDPSTGFATIGMLDYQGPKVGIGESRFSDPAIRHRYNFTPVDATGFRIVTNVPGTGIDEIELYPTASPVTPLSPPRATLIETGGTAGPGNVAAASAGATAFAQDVICCYAEHTIENVNDGLYGNSESWIGAANGAPSFVGVDFGGTDPLAINRIAFGRDNGGEPTEFTDRTDGRYLLQYTTTVNPDGSTPDSAWITIEEINYGPGFLDGERHLRHLYEFDAVSATGIRLVVSNNNIAIDELEAYAVPEPSSALVLGGVAGAALLRRRRRAQR